MTAIPRLPDAAIRCWETVKAGLGCEEHGDACRPPCDRWKQGAALDTIMAMLHAASNSALLDALADALAVADEPSANEEGT